MTTYTLHTLYLVACSILPERKHRRCLRGSRKERIGNAIRSKRKAVRPGTPPGSLRNTISGVVKQYATPGNQSSRGNHKSTEIALSHHEITVNSPLIAFHTLNIGQNAVKRTCARIIDHSQRDYRGQTSNKHITNCLMAQIFPIGGYTTLIYIYPPFVPPNLKRNLM